MLSFGTCNGGRGGFTVCAVGSNTINGPAGRSDLSDHNSQSLPTMETDPLSEQSQYPEDASIPLSNSFSGLMDDDPGDGDIHTASPSHSPNDVRHATQDMKSSAGKKTKNPKQIALLSMRTTSPPSIQSSC